ncbi:hypothetical protein D9M71_502960 [compost metagenome]
MVAVFGKAGRGDLQGRWGVLADGAQQLETALAARRIALLTIGAIALKAISGILNQGAAIFGQVVEFGGLQQRSIGTEVQYPLLFGDIQRLGAA